MSETPRSGNHSNGVSHIPVPLAMVRGRTVIGESPVRTMLVRMLQAQKKESLTVKDPRGRLFSLVSGNRERLAEVLTVAWDNDAQALFLTGVQAKATPASAAGSGGQAPPEKAAAPDKSMESLQLAAAHERIVRMALSTQVALGNGAALFLVRVLFVAMRLGKMGPSDTPSTEQINTFVSHMKNMPIVTELLEQAFKGEGALHAFSPNIAALCTQAFPEQERLQEWVKALSQEQEKNRVQAANGRVSVVSGKAAPTIHQVLAKLENGKPFETEGAVRAVEDMLSPRKIQEIAKDPKQMAAFRRIEQVVSAAVSPAVRRATDENGRAAAKVGNALHAVFKNDSGSGSFSTKVTDAFRKMQVMHGQAEKGSHLSLEERRRDHGKDGDGPPPKK